MHGDATAILRQARNMKQAVVVVCKNKDAEGKGGANANEFSLSGGEVSNITGGLRIEKVNPLLIRFIGTSWTKYNNICLLIQMSNYVSPRR